MLREVLIFGLCFAIIFAFGSGEISVRLEGGKATLVFAERGRTPANSIVDAATDALSAVQDLSWPAKTALVLTSAVLALAILVWMERRETLAATGKRKKTFPRGIVGP